MTVLVGFLITVFVVAAHQEHHWRRFPMWWLVLGAIVVSASFYSLRVIS